MTKAVLLCTCIYMAMLASAQVCQNPGARLARLRAPGITRDTIYEWEKSDLDFIHIQPHDTIADIGSYDGLYPLLYAIFTDSAVFYLNDIQTAGFDYFDTIQDICTRLRGSAISDQFLFAIGSDSTTDLPRHLFTKVIISDALHHFRQMDAMLSDVKRILSTSPGARLLLYEPVRGRDPGIHLCSGAMTREELVRLLNKNGFSIVREVSAHSPMSWLECRVRE